MEIYFAWSTMGRIRTDWLARYIPILTIICCFAMVVCSWQHFGGYSYKIFSSPIVKYSDAIQKCQEQNAWVVTVSTKEENEFARSLVETINYWIGLDDIDVEGRLTWIDGSTDIPYSHWHPNPNTAALDCVKVLNSGRWQFDNCNDPNYILCEKDTDECAESIDGCLNNAACVNTLGSYSCSCAAGFRGNRCEEDTDECAESIDGCLNNAACVNTLGSYSCSCAAGFRGNRCEEDVDECAESIDNCPIKAICVNTPGSYNCSYAVGFSGVRCEKGCPKVKAVKNDEDKLVCIKPEKLTELAVAKERLRTLMECFQYCVAVEHCNANVLSNAFQIQQTGVMCCVVEYDGDLSKCVEARGCNLYIMNTT